MVYAAAALRVHAIPRDSLDLRPNLLDLFPKISVSISISSSSTTPKSTINASPFSVHIPGAYSQLGMWDAEMRATKTQR